MPSLKQKIAFKEATENHGNISKAMKKAGYKLNTIKKPTNLTKSKGWKELMDTYLPDEALMKVHKEGLQATTKKPHLVDRDDKGRPIYEYVPEKDFSVRHKYLETGYKIKSKLPKEGVGIAIQVNVNEDKNEFA